MAIAWGCHYFLMYLLGSHFKVVTDHKPLLSIFNSSTSQDSARIENWRLKLQSFNFEVLYSRGYLNPADYISRHLQSGTKCDLIAESAKQYVKFVMSQATLKALSREEIIEAGRKDVTLQEVMRLISTGQWDNLKPVDGVDPSTLKVFANVCIELTSVDSNLVLRGSRMVIPDALQKQVVELAHKGHQGLVKTRTLLRSKVWFPGMGSLVDSIVKRCVPCQVATPKLSHEPLQMTPLPNGPWEQVSINIDYGVPEVVNADNGPPFKKCLGFKHRKVSPLWLARSQWRSGTLYENLWKGTAHHSTLETRYVSVPLQLSCYPPLYYRCCPCYRPVW